MIKEDYVSFEVAQLLKDKGFDGDTSSCYILEDSTHHIMSDKVVQSEYYESQDSNEHGHLIQAPTHQMAMKWLREVHNIHIELNWDKGNQLYSFQIWKPGKFRPEISSLDLWKIYKDDNYLGEWIYEEAAEAGIKYCLKNLI